MVSKRTRAARTAVAARRVAENTAPVIREIQASGVAALNARGVRTARGGRWAATQVGAVLARVGREAGSAGPLVCKAGVVEWEGG